ncbi:MAG: bifunctional demethylmenaquinone methyltransferase/2-methoxy-6-polyprenyl-1,4-benzoquinol methylase UbiE [Bacteroidetes bacterium]|nr:bifunctional demethylmenaquinone methyltransferase/2-methoxy-6-polyprenyl-1,4-benzoquinol methylase UbiE [Bacteroidota bacterium]
MFDNISGNYDLLNRLLSAGIDVSWRKKALKLVQNRKPEQILDVATGTGDFAIEAYNTLKPNKMVGIDISNGMLEVGREKLKKRGMNDVEFIQADSADLPFEDNTFDLAMAAFGVRNFENLRNGLKGMVKTLKPGGEILVLEFSKPRKFPFKQLYFFYFKNVLPFIGRIISKDSRAYTYLPESVQAFPDGQAFIDVMEECGLKNNTQKTLTFGIASVYHGVKA